MKGGRQLSEHFSRTRKMYKQTRVIYLNLLINYTERKQTRNRKPSCTEALWREQLIGLIRPKTYSVNINNEQTKLPALRFSVSLQAINNNFAVKVGTRSNTARNQPLFVVIMIGLLVFFGSNYSDTLFATRGEDCNRFQPS